MKKRRTKAQRKAVLLDGLFYNMMYGYNKGEIYRKFNIGQHDTIYPELLEADLIQLRVTRFEHRYKITGKGIDYLFNGE